MGGGQKFDTPIYYFFFIFVSLYRKDQWFFLFSAPTEINWTNFGVFITPSEGGGKILKSKENQIKKGQNLELGEGNSLPCSPPPPLGYGPAICSK